jgi:hypothetical protein
VEREEGAERGGMVKARKEQQPMEEVRQREGRRVSLLSTRSRRQRTMFTTSSGIRSTLLCSA